MQTHEDNDIIRAMQRDFMDRLRARAAECVLNKASEIAGGKEDEQPLAVWNHDGMQVTHRPDDEQGIVRISVGGGSEVIPLDYCVIRGSVGKCIVLLERAIAALRKAP